MRKPLGNGGEATAVIPLLRAAMLLLLFSAAVCHAQLDCTMTQAQAAQAPGTQYTDFEPLGWPAGQTTTVTAYGSWTTPSLPVGCWSDWIQVQGLNADGSGGTGVPDPNVTISDTINYGLTQTTFTVTVAANAPYTKDLMNFGCLSGSCPEWSEIFVKPLICPFAPPTITSVSPDIWDAGQTYNVTITGTNFVPGTYLGGSTAYPGCPATYMNITTSAGTLSYSYTFASATTITATVTPTAGDPAATATILVSGPPAATATAQIVPASCAPPTVTSISPNVWWAGQSYKNVTVTGANFITPANATAVCPATTVTITGASFTLGAVTVNSATQITIASVQPAATDTTAGVTVKVTGISSASANLADVLGAPQIQWNGKTISGTGATAQSAVVGQNVVLTGIPTAVTLGQLPIPVTIAPSPPNPNPWTAGGTNIGNYTASTGSASVTPTDLSQPTLNTYWVYPKQGISVTYQYCVDTPSQDDLCPSSSAPAKATFNVSGGGTMANNPYKQLTIDQLIPCVNGLPPASGGTKEPYVVYGNTEGYGCSATVPGSTFGITFTPSGAPSGGTYSYVQLINSDDPMSVDGNSSYVCTHNAGLDTAYPYTGLVPGKNPPQAEDAPNDELVSGYVETRTFNATMFLMWTPKAANGAATIPVPIGYQTWGFSGGASQNAKGTWVATTNGKPGPQGSFTPSNNQTQTGPPQIQNGYPIWTGGPSHCTD